MTLQNAAYVRAVGQIELIFTFAASYLVFKERSTKLELGRHRPCHDRHHGAGAVGARSSCKKQLEIY